MHERRVELLGAVAGCMTTAAYIPQVVEVWINVPRPAVGVSVGMFLMMCTGVALWLTYGLYRKSYPLIIANGITLVLSGLVLTYKLLYG